jgi:tetratricopeptide (TPR) repeat protein
MRNPIVKKLYTKQELEHKVKQHNKKLEKFQIQNDYRSIASEYYNIGRLFELLKDKEKSEYYYQQVVNEWNMHPDDVFDSLCVSALRALKKPEKALEVVLSHAKGWHPEILAHLYEEIDRKEEAQIIYTGVSYYSYQLSEIRYFFWRPHYLQKASDFREKVHDLKISQIYNQRAIEAWEKMKENFDKPLELIEEAWLYEEVGYIYEKAKEFERAMDYYKKAQSKYKKAYDEDPEAVVDHHIDGDWDEYFGFFAQQIPDFRLIHFRSDGPEENDQRRIKYRILNLEEQMKTKS